ncbi:hypothetical protein JCM10213v2_005071 [Rhodosporidiobolus nylandii]
MGRTHPHPNPDPSFHHQPVNGSQSRVDVPTPVSGVPAGSSVEHASSSPVPSHARTTAASASPAPATAPASTATPAAEGAHPTPAHHATHEPTPSSATATPASTTSDASASAAKTDSAAAGEERHGEEKVRPEAGEGESAAGAGEPEGGYPPQLHAGKVGLGPHYKQGGGLADSLKGKEEVLKGKLKHDEGLIQQGHDRQSGVLAAKQRAAEDEDSPFTRPDDGATQGAPVKQTTAADVRDSGHAASASAGTASTKQE